MKTNGNYGSHPCFWNFHSSLPWEEDAIHKLKLDEQKSRYITTCEKEALRTWGGLVCFQACVK